MKRESIPFDRLTMRIVNAWAHQWFLLAAGENKPGQYNVMTIAWGSFGVMWTKPFAMVVVRPTRHTYKFMEKNDGFTLSALPDAYKEALTLCGSKSGRDHDKIKDAKLTPINSSLVAAPGFDEAELIVECRKMYYDDFDPKHFLADFIAPNYNNDYHRVYFGEIVAVSGTQKYRS